MLCQIQLLLLCQRSADDIWLLAISGTDLQQLVLACKGELHSSMVDMSINLKKSAYVRIGPRFRVTSTLLMARRSASVII